MSVVAIHADTVHELNGLAGNRQSRYIERDGKKRSATCEHDMTRSHVNRVLSFDERPSIAGGDFDRLYDPHFVTVNTRQNRLSPGQYVRSLVILAGSSEGLGRTASCRYPEQSALPSRAIDNNAIRSPARTLEICSVAESTRRTACEREHSENTSRGKTYRLTIGRKERSDGAFGARNGGRLEFVATP